MDFETFFELNVAGEMQLMRTFWDAASELDPTAKELDEGRRCSICHEAALRQLFEEVGLKAVRSRAIDIPTLFENFDDYWTPFLGGQGPAPRYATALAEDHRAALCEFIRSRLPLERDDSIDLRARAWAVRGKLL